MQYFSGRLRRVLFPLMLAGTAAVFYYLIDSRFDRTEKYLDDLNKKYSETLLQE
ncbi:MAG: hypothetical protein HYW27_04570 [Candidatus Aenigmarchaeota archaeon]|nr:hypothetical protein [Candidatus Aenigmarchaeota archaeon]